MLVLTRKKEESVDIFDAEGKRLVTVCLVKIKGKNVRMGFIAEKEIVILRKELANAKIKGEQDLVDLMHDGPDLRSCV